MIALLVVLTFLAAVLIDHLLNRNPIPIATEAPRDEAPRPRLVPPVVAGFALPDNLRYHPGHTWAVAETPELVRIGIDDMAAKIAGDITSIDVPERGQWIRQGQKIIAMHVARKGAADGVARELDLVSPIEGTVVGVNRNALDNPTLAQTDPYGDGWLLTVSSPDASTNFRNLLGGTLARRWMDDAAAKLRSMTMRGAALAQDGGTVVDGVIDQLPEADWDKVTKELFAV